MCSAGEVFPEAGGGWCREPQVITTHPQLRKPYLKFCVHNTHTGAQSSSRKGHVPRCDLDLNSDLDTVHIHRCDCVPHCEPHDKHDPHLNPHIDSKEPFLQRDSPSKHYPHLDPHRTCSAHAVPVSHYDSHILQRDPQCDPHIDSQRKLQCHPVFQGDPVLHCDLQPYCVLDSHCDLEPHIDLDPLCDIDQQCDLDPQADSNPHCNIGPHCDLDQQCDLDPHADIDPHCDILSQGHLNTQCDLLHDPVPHCFTVSQTLLCGSVRRRSRTECGSLLVRFALIIALLPFTANATWWYLSQLPVQSLSVAGSGALCDNIPGLIGRQRRLCLGHTDVMRSVVGGAKMGMGECQRQFERNRWNCSASAKDSTVFGKLMLRGSREAAFVYAVSSAGVVHAITRACSKGDLLNCACDPTKHGMSRDERGQFEWGGCSDNVRYGSRFARRFVDAREKRVRDARALMNVHNNRAGRQAVRRFRQLECKCHGVSGSCTVRTCWLAMQEFRRVGRYLRGKYRDAVRVTMDQAGTGLTVAHHDHKSPTRRDLVYFEESPDYCVEDPQAGSHGTAGRECARGSEGPDGCDILCCGRGYDTRTVRHVTKCECKFHWCCFVRCKQCEEWRDVHTCKGPNPTPTPAAPPVTPSPRRYA